MPVQAAVIFGVHHAYLATSHEPHPIGCASGPSRACCALDDDSRVDSPATRRTALVGRERESQHIDGLVRAPQQRTVAGAEPAQPVAARVTETATPVVVERVKSAQLAVTIDLEAGLLDAARSTAINPRIAQPASDFPALVVGVVIRPQVHVDPEGD